MEKALFESMDNIITEKVPFASKERMDEIIRQYPTPFHIYDERGIRENVRRYLDAFSWNSGFREYFAVKATPNPVILEILKEEGCGLDCSSYTELMLAKALGFSGDSVMFSSNDTPPEEYAFCREIGGIINLDDITHINVVDQACGLPDTISLRYNPGGGVNLSNSIMDNPIDAKYGLTRKQIKEAIRLLKSRGVENFGLHSFIVSCAVSNDYHPMLANMLFSLAREIKEELDVSISFINLSGGLGIPYYPNDINPDVEHIAAGVKKAYDRILVPAGLDGVKIYTELGRYITGPYGQLVTTAIHEKHIYKDYIGVDACAADLLRPAMYGAYHHITVLGKENDPQDHKYDIVGALCENNDKFAIDRELPYIEVGDVLVLHDTGAHGHCMGYNYNGRLRSAELLLQQDGDVRLIRRAESPRDYFATLDFDPALLARILG